LEEITNNHEAKAEINFFGIEFLKVINQETKKNLSFFQGNIKITTSV